FVGSGLLPETVAWARSHFIRYVRSGGPYPALRCGRQPYGILPVTSLDLWKPGAAEQTALPRDVAMKAVIIKVRDWVWRQRQGDILRLGRRWDPPDLDADLADVMRTDALSNGYSTRSVFGRHYFQHLRAFLGEDLVANNFFAQQTAFYTRLLISLGSIPWGSRTLNTIPAEASWEVRAPLVQAGEVSPWTHLQPNYIASLLAERRIDALIGARPDPAAPASGASLLQCLLRHALLRELAQATALVAAGAPGTDVMQLVRDTELIDLVTGAPPTLTWKRQLDLKVPGDAANRTIRQLLEGLTTYTAPSVTALGEFRTSLAYLQGLDTEALQYLAAGPLDLPRHRPDAGVPPTATTRLEPMRTAGAKGAYAGGYAWVQTLRRGPASTQVPAGQIPAGEQAPLVFPANDSGFIHAP